MTMTIPEEVKDVAQNIGQFYLKKNNGDYKATAQEILALRISKIEVANSEISITTGRPGLLIGKRGTTIDALSQHLKVKIKIFEDVDHLSFYLIPCEEWEDS